MVSFKVISFHVSLTKQQGYYVTITGYPEGRDNSMRCKKFLKGEKLQEIMPLLMDGELQIIVLGKREQSDFEKKHNLTYYDFQLEFQDW